MPWRKLFAVFPPTSTKVDMLETCQNHISIGLMYPNWLSSGMLNVESLQGHDDGSSGAN